MSKNGRYILSFSLTILIFLFLWMYNDQKNQIQKLENQIEEKDVKIKVLESEYQACKGEIFHKNKLLEMEKRKTNKASVDTLNSD